MNKKALNITVTFLAILVAASLFIVSGATKDRELKEPIEYELHVYLGSTVSTIIKETEKSRTIEYYRPVESVHEVLLILIQGGEAPVVYSYPEHIDYAESGQVICDKETMECSYQVEVTITFKLPDFYGAILIDLATGTGTNMGTLDHITEGTFSLTGTGIFSKTKGGGDEGSVIIPYQAYYAQYAYRFGELIGLPTSILNP
jgi:hypothetical protein